MFSCWYIYTFCLMFSRQSNHLWKLLPAENIQVTEVIHTCSCFNEKTSNLRLPFLQLACLYMNFVAISCTWAMSTAHIFLLKQKILYFRRVNFSEFLFKCVQWIDSEWQRVSFKLCIQPLYHLRILNLFEFWIELLILGSEIHIKFSDKRIVVGKHKIMNKKTFCETLLRRE